LLNFFNNMYTDALQSIGLSDREAKIYDLLLTHGAMPASRIARLSGIERSLVYVHLNELVDRELVLEHNETKVARFASAHPQVLERLVQQKHQEAESASASLSAVFHQMTQQFETLSGQPGVRFFSGADGLEYINKQLRSTSVEEMLLIRSGHSSAEVPEYQTLIHHQRELRLKKKVPLKVIGPAIDSMKQKIGEDKESLTERRIIAAEMFDTPSQILIYNNTVVFTTFQEPMLTTIIEHEAIAVTVKTLFMYIWRSSLAETKQNIKKYT